jgi:hypothetical protein
MADHGTVSRYNDRRDPCRCSECKRAWADYMKNRRTKVTAERTKSRVVKPEATNVVQLKPTTTTTQAPDAIGPNRAAVMARLDQIGCDNLAVRATCGAMADVLDDSERIAMHVQACKQLDFMLDRESRGKTKKSRGKLQAVQNLSSVRRRAAQ